MLHPLTGSISVSGQSWNSMRCLCCLRLRRSWILVCIHFGRWVSSPGFKFLDWSQMNVINLVKTTITTRKFIWHQTAYTYLSASDMKIGFVQQKLCGPWLSTWCHVFSIQVASFTRSVSNLNQQSISKIAILHPTKDSNCLQFCDKRRVRPRRPREKLTIREKFNLIDSVRKGRLDRT